MALHETHPSMDLTLTERRQLVTQRKLVRVLRQLEDIQHYLIERPNDVFSLMQPDPADDQHTIVPAGMHCRLRLPNDFYDSPKHSFIIEGRQAMYRNPERGHYQVACADDVAISLYTRRDTTEQITPREMLLGGDAIRTHLGQFSLKIETTAHYLGIKLPE